MSSFPPRPRVDYMGRPNVRGTLHIPNPEEEAKNHPLGWDTLVIRDISGPYNDRVVTVS